MTSLTPSPTRSSKRALYYVQSPSRDSYTSVTQPIPMGSPTHDSSSLGRHSRNSSASRFSGISRSSSSDKKNIKKCRSNEKEYESILEEGSYDEMEEDVTSMKRCQALLAVFTFVILFTVCCLITWGASRPYKAKISVKTFELRNFYVGEGSDFSGMHTKLLTLNGTLRIGIYNPAPTFGIHVSSTPINLFFYQLPIATGQLKEHYQHKKSLNTEAVVIEGRKIPLYGAGASLEATERGGKIPVNTRFEVRTRGDVVGRLVSIWHTKRISCSFVIDVAVNRRVSTDKSDCSYS
ncbi:unnamed protein product [Eruca vesicaria subsp. sativa]|uniref:Late embryogenesis abundant protein LEA-2 subgroup domain-containing protein n=1 Tax=Eruca vesicaria subsp. sativa TaxID=29727 RepID=A0ABC8JSI6_ERUVS|nr:unnamed protein product [Eruca vesicaria subsp. sativa]